MNSNISTIIAASALTAGAIPLGNSAYDKPVLDTMNSIAISDQPNIDFSALFKSKQTPMHQKNFKWRSQRKIRKNRRRAHAAGAKNAFGR